MPASVRLPWRERLMAEGIEFTRYFTHSSPCSPSRASMLTGRYLPGHGVIDNVIMPEHKELDPSMATLGSLLRGAGYRSSYIGKWHLSQSEHPDMEAYGYADWDGNDRHFMGWAGTGVHFDPIIASNAAQWLRANARSRPGVAAEPWFLTVALVNPHDVMWFPIDQPGYEERNPEDVAGVRRVLDAAAWKDDDPLPIYRKDYDEVVDELPANFHDDLHTKPEAHRQWRWDQQHGLWGYIDPGDTRAWLRHLDYYVELQRLADESLGTVLGALEDTGAWDDTVVIFTSDHGDMCGSHGLRSKGPFVYDEIMRVPLYMRVPGVTTPGSTTGALATHVDLAATICALAGVDGGAAGNGAGEGSGLQGVDFSSVLADPAATCARPRVVRPGLGADDEPEPRAVCAAGVLRRRRPSTPATTGWAGASRRAACGEGTRARSCSTSTATSTTRTTSGTTTAPIRSSSSTWPTTGPGAPSCAGCSSDCVPTRRRRWSPLPELAPVDQRPGGRRTVGTG